MMGKYIALFAVIGGIADIFVKSPVACAIGGSFAAIMGLIKYLIGKTGRKITIKLHF